MQIYFLQLLTVYSFVFNIVRHFEMAYPFAEKNIMLDLEWTFTINFIVICF